MSWLYSTGEGFAFWTEVESNWNGIKSVLGNGEREERVHIKRRFRASCGSHAFGHTQSYAFWRSDFEFEPTRIEDKVKTIYVVTLTPFPAPNIG